MAVQREISGGAEAVFPVTVPQGTAFALGVVNLDPNTGLPIGGGGGGAATIADGADTAEGSTTSPAYTDSTGAAAGTLVGVNKGEYVSLRAIQAGIGAPSDSAATNITGSWSDTALLKTIAGGVLDTTTPSPANITQVGGSSLVLGQAADAGGVPVTLSSNGTYAKDASITGMSAKLPATLGYKLNSTSLAVVQPKSATGTSTNVPAATTSTSVLAANTARIGASIVNDSTSAAYGKYGTGVSATSYDFYMAGSVGGIPSQFICPDDYVGVISLIWVTATGNARVSERTA